MAEPIRAPRDEGGRSLYISGYFSELTWRGEEPDYGYPPNHLPEVTVESMTVVPSYMAAIRASKKQK